MKRRRHTPEQVIRKLAEAKNIEEVTRHLEGRPGTVGETSTAG
jgi:hypothetical protein